MKTEQESKEKIEKITEDLDRLFLFTQLMNPEIGKPSQLNYELYLEIYRKTTLLIEHFEEHIEEYGNVDIENATLEGLKSQREEMTLTLINKLQGVYL